MATDLDTRFVAEHRGTNLEVRTHDIRSGAPERAAFDLVHARALVEHIPDHQTAVGHLLAAVRPGGWVLIEDVDFGVPMAAALARYTSPPEHGPIIERLYTAGEAVFAAAGADASYGTQLVHQLEAAGFEQIEKISCAPRSSAVAASNGHTAPPNSSPSTSSVPVS